MTPPLKRGGIPMKRGGVRRKRGIAAPIGLSISTTSLGDMVELQAIPSPGFPVVAVGGVFATYVWEKVSGPSWLSISGSGSTGRVLGTPPSDAAGDIVLRVRVSQPSTGQSFEQDLAGTVEDVPTGPILDISTDTLGSMTEGEEIPAPGFAVVAVNGTGPYQWSKVLGPSWLIISGTGATARITGTPPVGFSGDTSFWAKVIDSLGQEKAKVLTGHVDPDTSVLTITSTDLGDMVETEAIPGFGFPVQTVNGVAPFTFAKISGAAWLSVVGGESSGNAGIVGTPPAGSAGTASINVRVTDSTGATDTQVLSGTVTEQPTSDFAGYFDRRIGFTKNLAGEAQLESTCDLIASGTGSNRIVGGLIRFDCGGQQMGGSNVAQLPSSYESLMKAVRAKGVFTAPILGYTNKIDQRRLTFQGSIHAAKYVTWNGLVGNGIHAQLGVAAITVNGTNYPALRPSAANNYFGGPSGDGWYGDPGGGVSVHGPGIPYLQNQACSIQSGSNILTTTLPTGNNPGANCGNGWVGQKIECSGVPAGTTVTAVIDGTHLRMSANANATGSRTCIIGIDQGAAGDPPRPFLVKSHATGSVGLKVWNPSRGTPPVETTEYQDHLNVGASGTYYIGGTNQALDHKIWYDDPRDYQKIVHEVVKQGNAFTPKPIKRAEVWNEMPWGMGVRPVVDIARAGRMLCHAYVGVKLADPSVIVCLPSSGHVADDYSGNQFMNNPDWCEALLNFWYNIDPNYFSDLLAANSLTKTRAVKIPGDEFAAHPYSNNHLSPTDTGMGQCANVFNQIGEASGGEYLPIAPTEQGVKWDRNAGGSGVGAWLNAQGGFTAYNNFFKLLWGDIPWSHNRLLEGPGAGTEKATGSTNTATTITLATRRAKMKQVFSCATMFAIREPGDASGKYGIRWGSDGSQKYIIDTNDPMHSLRTL